MDDAARLLERAYRRFEELRPTLTPGRLNTLLTLLTARLHGNPAAVGDDSVHGFAVPYFAKAAQRESVFALGAVAGEAGVLHHEDQHQTAFPIDAHVGRISSAVTEGRTRYRPAKAVTLFNRGSSLLARHLLDGSFREDALAFELAAAEHHPAKFRDVGSGRKQSAGRHRQAGCDHPTDR